MAPAFYALRHFFQIVDLTLFIVCFKHFICSHDKFPDALSHEETKHKYERRIKDLILKCALQWHRQRGTN